MRVVFCRASWLWRNIAPQQKRITNSINENAKEFEARGVKVKDGDWISIDGTTGKVYLGKVKTIKTRGSNSPDIFV